MKNQVAGYAGVQNRTHVTLVDKNRQEVARFEIVDPEKLRALAHASCVLHDGRYFNYSCLYRHSVEFMETDPPMEL